MRNYLLEHFIENEYHDLASNKQMLKKELSSFFDIYENVALREKDLCAKLQHKSVAKALFLKLTSSTNCYANYYFPSCLKADVKLKKKLNKKEDKTINGLEFTNIRFENINNDDDFDIEMKKLFKYYDIVKKANAKLKQLKKKQNSGKDNQFLFYDF